MELLERLLGKDYINKLRILFILFLSVILLISIYIYRPFIYSSNINDYSLANSFPSLIYMIIIVQISFLHSSINKIEFDKKLQIYAISLGLIIVELIQLFFTHIGTFDLIDIIYIIIGVPVTIFIEKIFAKYDNINR